MGFIDFTNGEVLTADQMDLVMRQGIMRFADASARDTALSEVLAEGMMAYLDDTDEVLKYDGTNWIDISGDITGVTAGTALTGGGTSGNVTLDVDESALNITASQISDVTATASELNTLDGITATTAELNFTDGVTSGIQSQLDGKQNDVITTQGDLIIGDASGDPVRLPVGSADQVLTSDGTTVSFQDAGGGSTTWTEIGTTSVGSGSQVTVTGLSGFNEYYIELKQLSCDGLNTFLEISEFNGTNTGDRIQNIQIDSSGENQTKIFERVFLGKLNQADSFLDAGIFIFGAGDTGLAFVDSAGGPDTDSVADERFLARGRIGKNNSPLSSFTLSTSVNNFDNGEIVVYGK